MPQLIKNSIEGYRNVPKMSYIITSLAYTLYLPIYMYAFDDNILFVRPDFKFAVFLFFFAIFQIVTIKIQQKYPRFLIPRSMRLRLQAQRLANAHQYEFDFEEDANRSTCSYLSDSSVK